MPENRLALIVATDHYENPTLHGLAAPAADAEALAEVLGDSDRGEFEVDVLRNPTSWVVAERVETLLAQRHPGDLVLLHFSCHGLKDESGELFLAATNTSPTMLSSTAVDSSLVNRLMQRSRAQRIVLLLDCCYGGAFERGVVARADGDVHVGGQFSQGQLGGGRGRVVITASSAMEYALEGTELTMGGRVEPSLFTGALVDGLRSGEADRNQDGLVGLDELYDYVFDKVKQRTPNQTPCRWEFGLQGDLCIARNPQRRIVPAPIPDDILELVNHPTPGVRLGAIDELTQFAVGNNLQRAAGAALLLRQLVNDDSRRVAEAAASVLLRIAPQASRHTLDLGKIPVGSAAADEITIQGTPLALASSVATSEPRLRAHLQNSVLLVEVTGSTVGPLLGWVRLTGPAGQEQIDVNADFVASPKSSTPTGIRNGEREQLNAELLAPTTPTPPAKSANPGLVEPAAADPGHPDAPLIERRTKILMAVLIAAGVVATVDANLLPNSAAEGTWWRYLPAAAAAVSLTGLFRPRTSYVALGLLTGAAAWTGAFWLRMSVADMVTYGPAATLQDTLNTGLWLRLVAFLLLTAAVMVFLARSATLRTSLSLARDWQALIAGLLVMVGAMSLPLDALTQDPGRVALPRELTLAAIVLALCLPTAIARLHSEQRLAALTAVTTFVLATGGRNGWRIAVHELGFNRAGMVLGLLVALAGCYIGQARARTSPNSNAGSQATDTQTKPVT